MSTVHDVVKKGVCVTADRVPCAKARKYLERKGLICNAKPPRPKPTPAKKRKKSLFEEWFG
jgi:hypothetical protein